MEEDPLMLDGTDFFLDDDLGSDFYFGVDTQFRQDSGSLALSSENTQNTMDYPQTTSQPYDLYTPQDTPNYTNHLPVTPSYPVEASPNTLAFQPPRLTEVPEQTMVDVAKAVQNQDKLLSEMGQLQGNFIRNPSSEMFNTLLEQQNKLRFVMDAELKSLEQIKTVKVLSPTNVVSLNMLQDKIAIQKKQLDLFDAEVLASLEEKPNNCCALLVIQDEPFPNIYFKEKKGLTRPIKLSLLKCSTLQIASVTPVNVGCLFRCPQVKTATRALDVERIIIDPVKGGQFVCQFLTGSRLETANLKFEVAIQLPNGAIIRLADTISRPFVVITNEKQFEEATKRLFIQEVFQKHNTDRLPWPYVANELAIYFLKATRQDLTKPTRGLSESDFSYLFKNKFGSQSVITVSAFEKFWDSWFGVILHELRYKRHLRQMWYLGLIYGFVDKEYMKLYLQFHQPGCCLLRFSETKQGSIAVNAMSSTRGRVSNYLIKAEETSAKKTHADFLRTKKELTHVLQFLNQYTPDTVPVLRPVEKDRILHPFYTQRDEETNNQGYDSWDEGHEEAVPMTPPADTIFSFVLPS